MLHVAIVVCLLVALPSSVAAFTLQFGNGDTIQTPVAGDVQTFRFTIDIDASLAAGVYQNPPIEQIDYRVSGVPIVGSPSGFKSFEEKSGHVILK